MSQPLHCDLELARRLEGAEGACSRAFCETAASLYPKNGILAISCGGGAGLFYGPGDPLNAVKGVGLNGPVDQSEWDALEERYRSTASPVVIDLCPLADGAFVSMLSGRGYTIGSFETVMCRAVDGTMEPSRPTDTSIAVSVVPVENAAAWNRVLALGFADGGEPMKFAVDIGNVWAHLPHGVSLLASVNGKPAGAAGILMDKDVAHMAGAAVLPEFRGRGIQSMLTAERLRIARERGCKLAKLDVHANSVSHRNAMRAGFQVAYTRPQMVKSW